MPQLPKEFITGYINLAKSSKFQPQDRFAARLQELISPGLSAKELIEIIVRAALEAEFGPSFTHSRGFDKMVSTIADSIVANPELRRQSLAIASEYLGKKIAVKTEEKNKNMKRDNQ